MMTDERILYEQLISELEWFREASNRLQDDLVILGDLRDTGNISWDGKVLDFRKKCDVVSELLDEWADLLDEVNIVIDDYLELAE